MGWELRPCEILVVDSLYLESNGISRRAEELSRKIPYLREGYGVSHTTILKCWRRMGRKIRERGGANATREARERKQEMRGAVQERARAII